MSKDQRQFLRHLSEIPVQISSSDMAFDGDITMSGVSNGGLSCDSNEPAEPGSLVKVRVPSINEKTIFNGRIAWCEQQENGYQLGIEFLDAESAFHARMCEQVCHIEKYRAEVYANEGRELTPEAAAAEWIEKNAEDFPS